MTAALCQCETLRRVISERDQTFAVLLDRAQKAEKERDEYRQELDGVLKMIGD